MKNLKIVITLRDKCSIKQATDTRKRDFRSDISKIINKEMVVKAAHNAKNKILKTLESRTLPPTKSLIASKPHLIKETVASEVIEHIIIFNTKHPRNLLLGLIRNKMKEIVSMKYKARIKDSTNGCGNILVAFLSIKKTK